MNGINSHNRIEPTTSVKEGSIGKQTGGNSTFARNSSTAALNNRPVLSRNPSDIDISFLLETKTDSVEQKLFEVLKNEQTAEHKKSVLLRQQSLKSLSMLLSGTKRTPKSTENQSGTSPSSFAEQAKVYIAEKSEDFPKLATLLNSEKSETLERVKSENKEQFYSGREKYIIDIKEAMKTTKDNDSRRMARGIETAVLIASIFVILGALILILS